MLEYVVEARLHLDRNAFDGDGVATISVFGNRFDTWLIHARRTDLHRLDPYAHIGTIRTTVRDYSKDSSEAIEAAEKWLQEECGYYGLEVARATTQADSSSALSVSFETEFVITCPK